MARDATAQKVRCDTATHPSSMRGQFDTGGVSTCPRAIPPRRLRTQPVPDAVAGSDVTATANTDQHPLAEAGQQATQTAGHLAERAADLGLEQADHGRHLAADGIETVARSIRRLSTEIAGDQPAIANAATTVADQAERTAQFLNETDAREMISKVEEAARRQPLLFLGARSSWALRPHDSSRQPGRAIPRRAAQVAVCLPGHWAGRRIGGS